MKYCLQHFIHGLTKVNKHGTRTSSVRDFLDGGTAVGKFSIIVFPLSRRFLVPLSFLLVPITADRERGNIVSQRFFPGFLLLKYDKRRLLSLG